MVARGDAARLFLLAPFAVIAAGIWLYACMWLWDDKRKRLLAVALLIGVPAVLGGLVYLAIQ